MAHHEGGPVHHQAPDGHQHVCQPVGHDGRWHEKPPVRPQEPYPAIHGPLNHQPANACGNRCGSQVGMMAPGTRWHICGTMLGTNRCDSSSMSLQMGCMQGANQSAQVCGLDWKVHDPKYCPQGPVADRVPGSAGHCPSPGKAPEYHPLLTRGGRLLRPPCGVSPHIISPSGILGFPVFSSCFSMCSCASS